MAKECSHDGCSYPVFSKGLCMNHWKQKFGKPLQHKPLTQTEDGGVAKPFRVINPISNRQAERLRKYRIARDEYFKDKPVCEYPGCTSTNITLHHGAGRIGNLLFDKRFFKSLCGGLNGHHAWAENNPDEAKAIGLSFDRTNK